MNIIAAVDRNYGIGKDGNLLLRIPEDMKNFKRLTRGKVVVMGHGTLKSLPGGKPLRDRDNIVLSRDASLCIECATVCNSIASLFEWLKRYDTNDVYVIGGQSVFEALLPYCSQAYITKLDTALAADRFFPDMEKAGWELAEIYGQSEYAGCRFSFTRYENTNIKSL